MPVHNSDIARIFNQIADLLEISGANPFRVRAYRHAARTVEDQPQSVAVMIEKGEDLSELSGIGKVLAGKITEIVATGSLKMLADLQQEVPEGLSELMRITQLGPKRVAALYKKLCIKDLEDLAEAARQEKQKRDGVEIPRFYSFMFNNTAFAGRRTLSAARLTADLLSLRSGATAASFKPRCRVAHRPPPSGPVCQQIESGPYPHPISARPARPPDKQRWRRRVQAYRVTGQQPFPKAVAILAVPGNVPPLDPKAYNVMQGSGRLDSGLSCHVNGTKSIRNRNAEFQPRPRPSIVSPCPLAPGTSGQIAQKPPSGAGSIIAVNSAFITISNHLCRPISLTY